MTDHPLPVLFQHTDEDGGRLTARPYGYEGLRFAIADVDSTGRRWISSVYLPDVDVDRLVGVLTAYRQNTNAGRWLADKTITEMTAEVREVNTSKGWRTGGNTFGDYIALMHSELSEALEAYRDHRLADATAAHDQEMDRPAKPQGVGSEFADLLIRLIDAADIYGIDLAAEYERKIAYNRTRPYQHGGRTLSDVGRVTAVAGKAQP